MNKPLKIVRPSEVLSKWVGETEQNISRLFREAAKEHSILLVDEADSFLHNRGDSVNHFEDSKVNSFLIEIERNPGILFCSTNLPDILDKAVDRRFNFKVGFKALTKEGVSLLCKSYFSFFAFGLKKRSRSELPTTKSELTLIAAAAQTGESSQPSREEYAPAASGMHRAL